MPDTSLAILLDRFVRRLHVAMQAQSAAFDSKRVGPGGAIILLTLGEIGEVPMHELTTCLVRDKSQLSRAVQVLEAKGLVTRRQSETDMRVSLVALTDEGQDVVDAHQSVLAATIDEMFAGLPEGQKVQMHSILSNLVGRPSSEA
ncbi:MAG: MarR family transcriptional regulator [Pseudomonadota bacterium]